MREAATRSGGYTLLEILVSISILALVLSGTYATVVQTRSSVETTEAALETAEVGHQAVLLFASLLESTYMAADRPELGFVGVSQGRDAASADRLRFISAAGAMFPLPGPPGDLVECTLELRLQPDGRRLLVLEVAPAGGVLEQDAGPAFALSDAIEGLDLSFLTPEGWSESFDPAVWEGLPEAVRIRIYRGGEIVAARLVALPLAETYPARRPEP